jgi:hypothetical protein
MVNTLDEILDEFDTVYLEVARTYQAPLDQVQLDKVAHLLLDLTEHLANYLESVDLLDPWAKENIVLALSRWNQHYDFAAYKGLWSTLIDRKTVSPENNYKKEIIDLRLEDILRDINTLRIAIKK